MRHRKFTFKIGRTSSHRRALLANAVCSLIESQRIKTTVPRAKQIRRLAEKMITLGKRGTLHARRLAIAKLRQPAAVRHLFSDIAPRYENRHGGYTRIMRLGPRLGDAAELCFLEFVEELQEDTSAEAVAETTGAQPDDEQPAADEAPAEPDESEEPTSDES